MYFQETNPIYLQIADWCCEQILTGKWTLGERILSVRELGAQLEVNPNTVLRAYDFLQNKAIFINKRGVGHFVTEEAKQEILTIKKERFFNEELPFFFKTLQLLDISLDEIKENYQLFIVKHQK
ncbi:MAG: GntR family transcriptional regulator [Bacteroidales bacterium]|jgi:DNA-binding transcriptional regulator YhcF (GntR family)|nr:GntR family transcriptional regulator [Bacteroidales bacterium]